MTELERLSSLIAETFALPLTEITEALQTGAAEHFAGEIPAGTNPADLLDLQLSCYHTAFENVSGWGFHAGELRKVFTKEVISEHRTRPILVARVFGDVEPMCSLDELGALLDGFAQYLEQNRPHLLHYGWPQTYFRGSLLFYEALASLYPTRLPMEIQVEDTGNELRNAYLWTSAEGDATPDYERGAVFEILTQSEAVRLEGLRPKVYRLKSDLLHLFSAHVASSGRVGSVDDVLDAICAMLDGNDIDFLIEIDRRWDKRGACTRSWIGHRWAPLAGGLSELLTFMGSCFADVATRREDWIMRTIGERIGGRAGGMRRENLHVSDLWLQGDDREFMKHVGERAKGLREAWMDVYYNCERRAGEFLENEVRDVVAPKVLVKRSIRREFEERAQALLAVYANRNLVPPSVEEIVSKELRSRAVVQESHLSPELQKEISQFKYRCCVRLEIPGKRIARASNVIMVDGSRVVIGDKPFACFIRLVVELLRGRGGWVDIDDLVEGKQVSAGSSYQDMNRVSGPFGPALGEQKSTDFIENKGDGRYRLSVPPSLIVLNRRALMAHPKGPISKLAKELPASRE